MTQELVSKLGDLCPTTVPKPIKATSGAWCHLVGSREYPHPPTIPPNRNAVGGPEPPDAQKTNTTCPLIRGRGPSLVPTMSGSMQDLPGAGQSPRDRFFALIMSLAMVGPMLGFSAALP